jgi:hypothetical protein
MRSSLRYRMARHASSRLLADHERRPFPMTGYRVFNGLAFSPPDPANRRSQLPAQVLHQPRDTPAETQRKASRDISGEPDRTDAL